MTDREKAHQAADEALLTYINHKDVRRAFTSQPMYYG